MEHLKKKTSLAALKHPHATAQYHRYVSKPQINWPTKDISLVSKSLHFDRPISVVDNSDYCIAQYDKTTENSGLKVRKSIVRMRITMDTALI